MGGTTHGVDIGQDKSWITCGFRPPEKDSELGFFTA